MNIDDLMNADYAIPDPAWDYSEVWHHTQAAAAFLRWRSPPLASLCQLRKS